MGDTKRTGQQPPQPQGKNYLDQIPRLLDGFGAAARTRDGLLFGLFRRFRFACHHFLRAFAWLWTTLMVFLPPPDPLNFRHSLPWVISLGP